MGQELSVVLAAEFLDQRNPHFPVDFKFLQFEGINDVSKIASNHKELLSLAMNSGGSLCAMPIGRLQRARP